jgi:hypothetical protein
MKKFMSLLIFGLFSSTIFADCPPASSITIVDSKTIIPPAGWEYVLTSDSLERNSTINFISASLIAASDNEKYQNANIKQTNCMYNDTISSYPGYTGITLINHTNYTTNLNPTNWKNDSTPDGLAFMCKTSGNCPFTGL